MKFGLTKNLIKTLFVSTIVLVTMLAPKLITQVLPFETQEAALFGVGSDEFTPQVVKSDAESTKSKVMWVLYIAAALLLLVLAYVFDIAAYAQKITGRKVANANKINAWLMLIFLILGLGFAAWEFVVHGPLTKITNASSKHGAEWDSMFMITLILTGIVFVVTQILLFVYAFMYQQKEGRKATYYSHNNRLEVFWTIIPAIVLTFLVLRGYAVWKDVMYDTDKKENVQEVELFAYQFGWTARYPGPDATFGAHSFNYISGTNQLGLAVASEVEELKAELKRDIEDFESKIANVPAYISELKQTIENHRKLANFKGVDEAKKELAKVESGDYLKELELMLRRRNKQLERMALVEVNETQYKETFTSSVHDDIIVKEIVVLKDRPVRLKFRSRDVIHSAFLPDFRVQMNCVPGMATEFTFLPTKSTSEIRKEKGDEEYNYYLFCNKICGQAHFNMKIKFTVVETEAEYKAWMADQKPAFPKQLPTQEEEVIEVAESATNSTNDQTI
jgi:cytochrome c oxidase subunit 2